MAIIVTSWPFDATFYYTIDTYEHYTNILDTFGTVNATITINKTVLSVGFVVIHRWVVPPWVETDQ